MSQVATRVIWEMGPSAVESVSVTLAGWDHTASAPRRSMTHHNKIDVPKRTKASSVHGEESVCVVSASVTPMTSAKCGGNIVNAMTSPVFGTRARCAQVRQNVYYYDPNCAYVYLNLQMEQMMKTLLTCLRNWKVHFKQNLW